MTSNLSSKELLSFSKNKDWPLGLRASFRTYKDQTDATIDFLERPSCSKCHVKLATINCTHCSSMFCNKCDSLVHTPDKSNHERETCLQCPHCEADRAELWCSTCEHQSCKKCFEITHNNLSELKSQHLTFCIAGARGSLFAQAKWGETFIKATVESRNRYLQRISSSVNVDKVAKPKVIELETNEINSSAPSLALPVSKGTTTVMSSSSNIGETNGESTVESSQSKGSGSTSGDVGRKEKNTVGLSQENCDKSSSSIAGTKEKTGQSSSQVSTRDSTSIGNKGKNTVESSPKKNGKSSSHIIGDKGKTAIQSSQEIAVPGGKQGISTLVSSQGKGITSILKAVGNKGEVVVDSSHDRNTVTNVRIKTNDEQSAKSNISDRSIESANVPRKVDVYQHETVKNIDNVTTDTSTNSNQTKIPNFEKSNSSKSKVEIEVTNKNSFQPNNTTHATVDLSTLSTINSNGVDNISGTRTDCSKSQTTPTTSSPSSAIPTTKDKPNTADNSIKSNTLNACNKEVEDQHQASKITPVIIDMTAEKQFEADKSTQKPNTIHQSVKEIPMVIDMTGGVPTALESSTVESSEAASTKLSSSVLDSTPQKHSTTSDNSCSAGKTSEVNSLDQEETMSTGASVYDSMSDFSMQENETVDLCDDEEEAGDDDDTLKHSLLENYNVENVHVFELNQRIQNISRQIKEASSQALTQHLVKARQLSHQLKNLRTQISLRKKLRVQCAAKLIVFTQFARDHLSNLNRAAFVNIPQVVNQSHSKCMHYENELKKLQKQMESINEQMKTYTLNFQTSQSPDILKNMVESNKLSSELNKKIKELSCSRDKEFFTQLNFSSELREEVERVSKDAGYVHSSNINS